MQFNASNNRFFLQLSSLTQTCSNAAGSGLELSRQLTRLNRYGDGSCRIGWIISPQYLLHRTRHANMNMSIAKIAVSNVFLH